MLGRCQTEFTYLHSAESGHTFGMHLTSTSNILRQSGCILVQSAIYQTVKWHNHNATFNCGEMLSRFGMKLYHSGPANHHLV
eukprot:scaffold116479_cov43-Prasinocladus_malaysianus.AAC.1